MKSFIDVFDHSQEKTERHEAETDGDDRLEPPCREFRGPDSEERSLRFLLADHKCPCRARQKIAHSGGEKVCENVNDIHDLRGDKPAEEINVDMFFLLG